MFVIFRFFRSHGFSRTWWKRWFFMKFGKFLASRQLELPEYSGHFIDYKALKKLIKQLAIPGNELSQVPQTQAEIQNTLKENKASFFFRVERELDKVNLFYLEKQANLSINLDLLIMKKSELLSNHRDKTGSFKNSISYLNLYQNFQKIHQDLLRLQQFIELNETGFLKVVKKWDKRSKSHTKELFILTAVSVQPVFHKNEINELSDLVTQSLFDLELIMDGDYLVLENYQPAEGAERRSSVTTGVLNAEIDELYLSFVNVATLKDSDLLTLTQWIEKIKTTSKEFSGSERYKISQIFSLSVTNLKISDEFLEGFLKLIDYQVDFRLVGDDFNNNKNIIHKCCLIPPASIHENSQHVIINNGVKVVNSMDSIQHTRTFIVDYILKALPLDEARGLLIGRDFNGRSCLHYAASNNRLDLLEIILPFFPKDHLDDLDNESMSGLLLAIKHGNFDAIKRLVNAGANTAPKLDDSKLQYLPINYACKFGNYPTVEYLLTSTASPELVNQQDVEGLLPLHVLARLGHSDLIKLLIDHGGDVNKLDGLNKWPPIFYAASEGHVKATQELVKHGAQLDIVDEDGYNVLYYCVVDGRIGVLNELLTYYDDIFKDDVPGAGHQENVMTILDDGEESEDSGESLDKNVDLIPHLELPPPILPLRRYGHNFLEQKVLIELNFPNELGFINLFSSTDLKPGRITLTSNISDIVPRNLLIPMGEEALLTTTNCIFQTDVESLNEFRIDFEVFPKFGTRLIAKTTALTFSQIDTLSPEINTITLPLFDLRLRNVGELRFSYQVIFPFSGTLLETSKFDTYWKLSTNFVKNRAAIKLNAAGGLSPNNFLSPSSLSSVPRSAPPINTTTSTSELISSNTSSSSFVTATSLLGEYLRIKICLLNDGTPVVCPHWLIAVTENIDLYLPNLSLDQLSSMTNSLFDYNRVIHDLSKMTRQDLPLIKKLLKIIYLPLDLLLEILSPDINLNLELIFPSLYELENLPFVGNIQLNLNTFIDFTLNDVFNHIRSAKLNGGTASRSIIFLSSNSLICKILNWKQPNFPVFLVMSGIVYKNNGFESRTTNGLLFEEVPDKSDKKRDHLLVNGQELTIRSIKEAVNFTLNNNLIGLITSIHLLNLVPKLIPLIRSRGLVLVASNDVEEDSNPKELDMYSKTEINGLRFDDVLSFKDDITM